MPPRSGIQLPSGAPIVPEGVLQADAPAVVDPKVELPRYRVATDVPYFDGFRLWGPGDELVHEGEPGPNLEPLNDAAKAKHEPVMKAVAADPMAQSKPVGMLAYAGAQAPSQDAQIAELKARLAVLEGRNAA